MAVGTNEKDPENSVKKGIERMNSFFEKSPEILKPILEG